MLAVIRANLGTVPQSNWSDNVVRSLFDPAVPYSFAHYWTRNSFGEADLRYTMFDPIAYVDPRSGTDHDGDRQKLVENALAEVARRFDPDWTLFEAAILLFTGQTDLFGGGRFEAKSRAGALLKHLRAAIFDDLAPFSSIVQEIGHAFEYDHEVGMSVSQEYASPYSAMSEQFSPSNTWMRAPDARLTTLPAAALGRDEPLREIGPFIPAAQFLAAQSPMLDHPDSVVTTPATFAPPLVVRITALDKAIADWPMRRRCVAVIPPSPFRARTYYLEVRRKADYDQGLRFGLSDGAQAGLVIHSWDPGDKRIHYEGALAFDDQAGDLDYRSFAGRFIVRFVQYDPDRAEGVFRLYDEAAWHLSGISIDDPLIDEVRPAFGPWTEVQATPCGPSSAGLYEYRTVSASAEVAVHASSFGFEKPGYVWFLNDQPLPGASGSLRLTLPVKKIAGTALISAGAQDCDFQFVVAGNVLKITSNAPWAAMSLRLQVKVVETSTEVVQNAYPERILTTDFTIDNVRIEWDDRYMYAMLQCWRKYWHLEKAPKPGQVKIKFDPRPKFDREILEDLKYYLVDEAGDAVDGLTTREAMISPAQLVEVVRQVDPRMSEVLRFKLTRDGRL